MTISTTTNRELYSGDGSSTVFSFPFLFFKNTDLVVVLQDTTGVQHTQILNTDYTVSGAGLQSGGSITMTVAPLVDEILVIYRDTPEVQNTSFNENDPLPVGPLEQQLDLLTMQIQRLSDRLNRAMVLQETDTSVQLFLPLEADRANTVLGFDSSGNPIPTAGTSGDVPISTFMATVVTALNAGEARTDLNCPPTPRIDWIASASDSPDETVEFNQKVFIFGPALAQGIYGILKVPQEYVPGNKINVYVRAYSPSTTNSFLLQTVASLIRNNTDAVGSTTNQRTSTNSAQANNATANLARQIQLDLTDAFGNISGVPVNPGDTIEIYLAARETQIQETSALTRQVRR